MEYYLDGRMMTNRDSVHQYIGEELEIPYGQNLDALYDLLTCVDDMKIVFTHVDDCTYNLGHYGYSLIRMLKDAANENEGFTLVLE